MYNCILYIYISVYVLSFNENTFNVSSRDIENCKCPWSIDVRAKYVNLRGLLRIFYCTYTLYKCKAKRVLMC